MKKIILIIALIFTCSWVEAQTYLQENFDTEIPATWTITDGGGATGDSWASGQQGGGNSLDGTNCAIVDSDSNGNGTELIETLTSPVFDTTGATTLYLDFDQFYNNIGADTAVVEVFDGTNWIEVLNQTADAGAFGAPDQQHIDITAYSNAAMQVRFIYNDGNVWAWYWLVDNVQVYNSTCDFPTDIIVTNITANTADISWTAVGTETTWEVVVQPVGSGEPTGSGIVTNTNPYTVTGLTAITDYEIYVRADCGTDGFSIWAGPINFQTACDVFVPDYLETFGTIIPNCWDEAGDGDATTGPTGLGAGDWAPDGFLNNGFDGAYKINLWQAFKSDWILSPQFDLTGGPFQVDFDFGIMQFGSSTNAGTLGSDDTVQLLISTDNGATWTSLVTFDNTSVVPATGTQVVFDLTAYAGQTVQFGILGSEGTVDDPEDNDVFVDNFRVRAIPSCQEPTGLGVDNITDTSVDVSWTPGGAEASWEVVVQPQGTGVPTGAGTATTDNPYTATPIDPSTDYEVWVRADCGANGLSSWTGPIDFSTLNTPPPPPNGVTCTSGSSSFIFTENFDENPPAGWTGTGFDGSNGNWDIAAAGANSFGTGPANAFDGGAGTHLEYEASGNATDIAVAISPAIDLSAAIDGAELSFFFHAFGADMGTLNVGIANDAAGPFTNLFTWVGDLQISDDEAWVPVGINLDAYLGQVIYLEFSYGGAGTGFEGDLSIDFVRVESCGSFCIPPSGITVSNITGTSADINWDANNGESSWEFVVVPSGTGEPTGAGTTVGATNTPISGLEFETEYEIWVRADCGSEFSIWSGPVVFTTTIQTDFTVDCSVGPITGSVCYGNNDSEIFTYTSSDGSPVNLTFNAGEVEGAPFDFLVVFDTDGTVLYNDEGNDGDISGLTFQSTGDTISWQVQSDGSVSCESGSFCCSAGIDYTVACATCINPAATYQVIDDCDNGDQFLIGVNVTSLGDATSLTISNNIDTNTVSAPAEGVYQVGPFPFGVDVIITLSNDQDVNCVINSSPIILLACPPDNDNPCDATVAGVNADDSCDIITSGTLLEATDSGVPVGSCGTDPDDDVWFEFTALNEFQIIQFTNINGGGFFQDLDHAVYEGACDALVELYCSDNDASLTPALTVGNTYYIRVFSAGDEPVDYTFDLCIRPGTGNVSVDQTTYTVEELVIDVLIDSPCAQIDNITFSTGTNFGSTNGIGYFSAEEGSFPFEEGLLLTSGDASEAAGPNFNAMSAGGFGWPGDPELDAVVGINSNNATIIEFDFVPLSDEISFDFLMASEEYNGSTGGTFECTFSDAFAFLLTDENNVTTNLAVLPGTTTPILVTNIHPENPGCPAINEEYFGGYVPQNLPPMSFDGRTTVFTAFSEVNIGETYRIKLVIADATDTALDSGVFLKAGSFDIGEVELGDDITIEAGTAACIGEQIVLETQALSVDHVWFKDGFVIEGETSNQLVVTEDGTYTTQIIFSSSCIISDEIVVEFLPLPIANTPPDLVGCSIGNDTAVFTLSDNDAEILGDQSPADFTVTYHLTEQDAIDGVDPLVSPYTSISDPQTVYAQITNNVTGCINTTSFNLVLGIEPATTFTQDFDYEVCPNATVPIIIEATPVNYTASEVTINWYLDGVLQPGENGLTFPVLLAGDYEIEVIFNDTGCSNITSQTVIELESCVIPQGISPNGDGMNDTFDLSSYRVSKLEIFNRYGTLVYSKTNYLDEWFGQDQDGNELPVGTYFYTMEYEDGKRRSAWVYIQRLN
ncbi:choice-of-anchor L domain-containing protein [uncultured Psychroserpens sp.]|uniref:choice-of-anchor L domain-containing protein n=1 Tax=uncultured Psychroserpens sp. TaxID=255436 RepID=UPI002639AC80|nr:choice-of-anchor L domain-containing protein [uncultured Psychroserpens sp.]